MHVVLHVVDHRLRPVRRLARVDLREPGVEARFGDHLPRARVVGVPVVGVRSEENRRSVLADHGDQLQLFLASGAEIAIAEVELKAEKRPEDPGRGERLVEARLRGAARPHLPARQIDERDLLPLRDRLEHRAAATDLRVVGMRAKKDVIDLRVLHLRLP